MSKKNIFYILILVVILISFSYIYKMEKSYEYVYNVSGYKISENYNKKNKIYTFIIDDYKFNIKNDYINKRKLVSNIEIKDNCLYIEGDLSFYNICKEDNYYTPFSFLDDYKKTKTYKDINIYNLGDNTYFLWNYRGFYIINNEIAEELIFLTKDEYNPSLIKKIDNLYLIPNYDQDYYFNSYYLFNIETHKYKLREMKHDYSYDLVYLDILKKEINIYDVKEEKEYTLEYEKGLSTHNKGIEYTNKELSLYKEKEYFYINDNKLLYKLYDYELIILEDIDINIVFSNEEEVYFLVADTLYVYNLVEGFNKIMSYSEWKFNYKNLIYIA